MGSLISIFRLSIFKPSLASASPISFAVIEPKVFPFSPHLRVSSTVTPLILFARV